MVIVSSSSSSVADPVGMDRARAVKTSLVGISTGADQPSSVCVRRLLPRWASCAQRRSGQSVHEVPRRPGLGPRGQAARGVRSRPNRSGPCPKEGSLAQASIRASARPTWEVAPDGAQVLRATRCADYSPANARTARSSRSGWTSSYRWVVFGVLWPVSAWAIQSATSCPATGVAAPHARPPARRVAAHHASRCAAVWPSVEDQGGMCRCRAAVVAVGGSARVAWRR